MAKEPNLGAEVVQKNHIDKKKSFWYNDIVRNRRFFCLINVHKRKNAKLCKKETLFQNENNIVSKTKLLYREEPICPIIWQWI